MIYNYPSYQYLNYNLTDYANQTVDALEEAVENCDELTRNIYQCSRFRSLGAAAQKAVCEKNYGASPSRLQSNKDFWCGQVESLRSTGLALSTTKAAEAEAEAAGLRAGEAKEEFYEAKASKWFIYVGLGLAVIVAGTLIWRVIKK